MNMITDISSVIIWSEDYKKLSAWYKEILGLAIGMELTHPQDTAIQFQVGKTRLWIGQHSLVRGKNTDSHRIMINFVVDSVSQTFHNLSQKGVIFIAAPFKAPTLDKYFATFYDLDNNLLQIV